ncbi:MAG: UbiX family flavin prenyltransferase [Candidatus Limnocylindrales bacterium]
MAEVQRRIVVGMSGSSGAIFGIRLLEVMSGVPGLETHLVMSAAAAQTIALETDYKPRAVEHLATKVYKIGDIAASLSSGSFKTEGMIVLPCSMKTVAGIAYGYDENLLVRAATVTLKEQRRLIVCPRETPLHIGHLRALTQLAEIGAVVCPLMPAFYGRPQTIMDIVDHQVGRLLDLIGVEMEGLAFRWKGAKGAGAQES